MEDMHTVSVRNLKAGYGQRLVLDGLTFDAEPGQVMTIAGQNGAGKSTLLRCLAGLLKPEGGNVLAEGRDIYSLSGRERARMIAALFTERIPREPETCFSVAAQGRYPYTGWLGGLSDHDKEIVTEAMRQTDCLKLRDRYFGELSDGQKQRVLLARAIAQQPKILLLDEPATYLDLRYQLELMTLLRRLAAGKGTSAAPDNPEPGAMNSGPLTVIMSLHDIRLAERFSDRILMLKDGKLYADGRPDMVVSPSGLAGLFDIDPEVMREFWGHEKSGAGQNGTEAAHVSASAGQDTANLEKTGAASAGQDTEGPEEVRSVFAGQDPADLQEINAFAPAGMRKGFTTGTTAALAAQGAATLLLTGILPHQLSVLTPAGIRVSVKPESGRALSSTEAECTVRKCAGDDVDATDGILITARVTLTEKPGILIDGGEGIGRVTMPGLDQPVGEAAINHVPRKMIKDVLCALAAHTRYEGGFFVLISAEDGRERAERTMNGMLGITGGISILGTSGIVEPMSRQALVDTIRVDIRQKAAMGHDRLVLVPGNMGADFVKNHGPDLPVAMMSNFVGEALDIAREEGFREVLLVGHVGKLVKLSAAIMNTHSSSADGRREIFAANAAMSGASPACIRRLWDCVTSDAFINVLREESVLEDTSARILKSIQKNLDKRTGKALEAGAVLFSGNDELFGVTEKGKKILRELDCDIIGRMSEDITS